MKFGRKTDLLSPQEREIVDRFERGVIDAAEAGRLLIDSVQARRRLACRCGRACRCRRAVRGTEEPEEQEESMAHPDETPDETAARLLVERIAREVDEELKR